MDHSDWDRTAYFVWGKPFYSGQSPLCVLGCGNPRQLHLPVFLWAYQLGGGGDISPCDEPPAFVRNGHSGNSGLPGHKYCLLYKRSKIHIARRNWTHDKYGLLIVPCSVFLYRRIVYHADLIYTDLL